MYKIYTYIFNYYIFLSWKIIRILKALKSPAVKKTRE